MDVAWAALEEVHYKAITMHIIKMVKTKESDQVTLELQLPQLLDEIKKSPLGASEAARAIRKAIKHGETTGQQIRALYILEMLVLNSGAPIGPNIAHDDKLFSLLKGLLSGQGKTSTDEPYHDSVREVAANIARGWKVELAGMKKFGFLSKLYRFIPSPENTDALGAFLSPQLSPVTSPNPPRA